MTIIRNAEVLDPSFIPSDLPFRESEIHRINELVLNPIEDGISSTLFVFGQPGVGKTTTVKYSCQRNGNFAYFYYNALSHPTVRSILVEILVGLRKSTVVKPSITEIFRQISKWQKESGKGIVIVIDEASNTIRNDITGLQMLLRSSETYSLRMSTIMISVDDPSTIIRRGKKISPLPISTLKFSKYSTEELYEIARRRAIDSLYEGTYSDEILRLISVVASTYGSARLAIEILQKAAYIADYVPSDIIRSDDVRAANAMVNPYITESKLVQLNTEELIVLLAVCRCLEKSTSTEIPCVVMNSEIIMESRSKITPSKSMIYRSLRKLEDVGILESRIEGRGNRRGVSKEIMLNDTPIKVLEEKLENILDHIG